MPPHPFHLHFINCSLNTSLHVSVIMTNFLVNSSVGVLPDAPYLVTIFGLMLNNFTCQDGVLLHNGVYKVGKTTD